MDFEFWFWVIVAFLVGRNRHCRVSLFYCGDDEDKYNKSLIGILLKK